MPVRSRRTTSGFCPADTTVEPDFGASTDTKKFGSFAAVSCEDIRAFMLPALRHRILLNFEGEAERVDTDTILEAIIKDTPEPSE